MTMHAGALTIAISLLLSLLAACGSETENQSDVAPSATIVLSATASTSPTPTTAAPAPASPTASPALASSATSTIQATAEAVRTPTPVASADDTAVDMTGDVVYGVAPDADIFVMNADGSEQRQLTDHPASEGSPVWSPDGRAIAYFSWHDGESGLFVMDADGSNAHKLADVASSALVWSPDGRQIALTAWPPMEDHPQIVVVAANGAGQRWLTGAELMPEPALSMGNGWPAWSPDGRTIAFIGDRSDNKSEVYVIDADGTNVRQLTDLPGRKGGVAWSADGELLACIIQSTDVFSTDIWVALPDGSGLTNLTASHALESVFDWSPARQEIVFVRQSESAIEIIAIDADGANERVLYDSPDHIVFLRWSPDGTRIVFTLGNLDRNSDIFVINADGSGLQQLTDTPASESDPRWSPDGMSIVYAAALWNASEK
jgi:Tol biopolymer transport system component